MTQLETHPARSDLLATAHANDRAHVFHSWSAQAALNPTVIAGGKGSRIWDDQGNEWIDFTSQLINVNIGHQHPKMIEAIKAQAEQLCTVSPGAANDVRSEAARLITERAPGNLDHVFFTNGGAEAIENAIRMAKGHTGRLKILSMYRSYHGSTTGAISLTGEGRRLDNEPGMPGAVKFWGPFLYRTAFHSSTEPEESARALQHLRDVITFEGTDKIAAIVLESVVGTNGVLVPPDGYLAGVRALCDEFGIMMICDEVMAGFGRCGEWFAVNKWNVVPDLIAFAKGVNSGYVPLGGVVISDEIVETFQHRVYQGGLTYSGHPLACASAVASINIFEDEGLLEHSRMLGDDIIGPALRDMAEQHPSVGEVRGLASFWAIDLVTNRETRSPASPDTLKAIVAECKSNGVWPLTAGNRVHVVPPCNTPVDEAREGLRVVNEALAIADAAMS